MRPVEKLSVKEARKWFIENDRFTVNVITTRAALRTIPSLSGLFNEKFSSDEVQQIILDAFVACVLTSNIFHVKERQLISSTSLRLNNTLSGNSFDDYATFNSLFAVFASLELNEIEGSVVGNAMKTRSQFITDYEVTEAAFSNYGSDTTNIASTVISNDMVMIDNGKKLSEALYSPLWMGFSSDIPPGHLDKWTSLKSSLLSIDKNWSVWTNWYEDRLVGGPVNLNFDIGRTSFPAEYYQNPAVLNAQLKVIEIELLAESTPLAERLMLKPDGKVDVDFLPVADLTAQNLERLKDTIAGCVSRNMFRADSEEVLILTDMLENHADNPQRIYDECEFVGDHIRDMIAKDYIDENLQTKRLVSALELTAKDILANEPEVQKTVAARKALSAPASKEAASSGDVDINTQMAMISEILSQRLNIEMVKDGDALSKAVLGGDKSNFTYRLVSRLTRIYLIIQRDSHLANISDTAKLSLINSLPHIDVMISALRRFVGN